MASLEEMVAALAKQVSEFNANINAKIDQTQGDIRDINRNMDSMRSGFINDVNSLRREIDERNQPRSKSTRIGEAYRDWVENDPNRGTSSRQERDRSHSGRRDDTRRAPPRDPSHTPDDTRTPRYERDPMDVLDDSDTGDTPRGPRRAVGRDDRQRGGRERREQDIQGIKFTLPTFKGTDDPNEFLEWKSRMEFIFACHEYSEFKKFQLAIVEFKDYAVTWWEKHESDAERKGFPLTETWDGLIKAMRTRFLPKEYKRDLHHKLEHTYQGTKSVNEYYKEMETLML